MLDLFNPNGAFYNVNFFFRILDSIKNRGTVTITANDGYTVTKTTGNSGFSNQQDIYSIQGSTGIGESTKIATIKIDSLDNYFFAKAPRLLSGNNNIKLALKTTTTSTTNNKETTSYTFDLIYTGYQKTTVFDKIDTSLNYMCRTTRVKSVEISKIICGPSEIRRGGARRIIRVYGTRGAEFALAINENISEKYKDVDGSSLDFYINNPGEDISILDQHNSTTDYYGKTINILSGKIGKKGFYAFPQNFPSASIKAYVKGTMAESGASKIKFGDLSRVRKGDRVYAPEIPIGTTVTVSNLNPDGDDPNEATLSSSITINNKKPVYFKRRRSYSLDIIKDQTSTLGSGVSTAIPSYSFIQNLDPVLTFKASTAGTDFTITKFNGVATSFSRGDDHTISFQGRANMHDKDILYNTYDTNRQTVTYTDSVNYNRYDSVGGGKTSLETNAIELTYVLDAHASHTYTYRTPVWSSTKPNNGRATHLVAQADGGSDWTNSVPSLNGGTAVYISVSSMILSTTSTTDDTLTITMIATIQRWGDRDVTMELDFDKILNLA